MKRKEGDILVNEQKDKNAHAGKRNYTDTTCGKIRNISK